MQGMESPEPEGRQLLVGFVVAVLLVLGGTPGVAAMASTSVGDPQPPAALSITLTNPEMASGDVIRSGKQALVRLALGGFKGHVGPAEQLATLQATFVRKAERRCETVGRAQQPVDCNAYIERGHLRTTVAGGVVFFAYRPLARLKGAASGSPANPVSRPPNADLLKGGTYVLRLKATAIDRQVTQARYVFKLG